MTRVEFRLAMPGRASWNGGWSGEGRNYSVVRDLSVADARILLRDDSKNARREWAHHWSDGWCAVVTARVVPEGEELPKSDGFNGYEWMIDNILRKDSPYGEVTS